VAGAVRENTAVPSSFDHLATSRQPEDRPPQSPIGRQSQSRRWPPARPSPKRCVETIRVYRPKTRPGSTMKISSLIALSPAIQSSSPTAVPSSPRHARRVPSVVTDPSPIQNCQHGSVDESTENRSERRQYRAVVHSSARQWAGLSADWPKVDRQQQSKF